MKVTGYMPQPPAIWRDNSNVPQKVPNRIEPQWNKLRSIPVIGSSSCPAAFSLLPLSSPSPLLRAIPFPMTISIQILRLPFQGNPNSLRSSSLHLFFREGTRLSHTSHCPDMAHVPITTKKEDCYDFLRPLMIHSLELGIPPIENMKPGSGPTPKPSQFPGLMNVGAPHEDGTS